MTKRKDGRGETAADVVCTTKRACDLQVGDFFGIPERSPLGAQMITADTIAATTTEVTVGTALGPVHLRPGEKVFVEIWPKRLFKRVCGR